MWSKTKRHLEEMLCDSLKKRVKFFVTQYRKSHGNHGRVCIIVDDKEIFNMCDLTFNVAVWDKEMELNESITNEEKLKYSTYWEANKITKGNGIFNEDHFFEALNQYFNNPIEVSLNSENMIVVILAILNRRVGKRTLKKINKKIESQHNIVQYFYKLRCEAEGII